ncbi:hypothetical protein [Methylophilus aquaticus]|uniref:HTH cro/C1-type domain-containing protein n=1 Tax=Methylophilus aquaticus TaxID=1971610 RepID=A0ABT9JNW2_9PROT|nr:hypothetical protein [Methylophilus aquaticus]MDP8566281.1 hypothetical protein [Methylophilus aquaticus]
MNNTSTYGGWFAPQAKTGNVTTFVKSCGLAYCTIIASIVGLQTAGEISPRALTERSSHVRLNVVVSRNPQENLKFIKSVFSPSILDLANTFDVSRQSIYNWLNGEQIADANLAKLANLTEAAEIFASSGIKLSSMILKSRLIHGKNLFQIVRDGGSAKYAANQIVTAQLRAEAQRSKVLDKFRNKKGANPTADFALPAPNEFV